MGRRLIIDELVDCATCHCPRCDLSTKLVNVGYQVRQTRRLRSTWGDWNGDLLAHTVIHELEDWRGIACATCRTTYWYRGQQL
ncbi:hypothetical protein FOA52_010409 [Chlamydomonas sp. UWO 241]|nr:hypothetical protein FOA52_010409 [Chlamydomonas sp. UWO 241]